MYLTRVKRLHSRAANGVDGEPALPWLMAGGTMQHPVVLDEATATRLGYGSSCVLAPADAVRASHRRWGDDGVGDGRRRRRSWPSAGGSDDDDEGESTAVVPEVGGYFRMWSDYRMALEGHATGVQVGTLLPPVLDMARTVADSFRRRWAAGGQYPERVLARVRLAERGNGREGGGGEADGLAGTAAEGVGSLDETEAGSRAREATLDRDAERRWRKVAESVSPGERRRGVAASGREGDGDRRDDGEGERGGRSGSDDQDQLEQQPPPAGLRQVLSRLDGLDSGALVERALEDHLHGEGEHGDAPDDAASASGTPSGSDQHGSGGGRGAGGVDDAVEDNLSGGATSVDAAALSAALDGSLATAGGPEDLGDDDSVEAAAAATATSTLTRSQDEDASSESGRDGAAAAAAAAAGAGIQTPAEEKFMLPGWHYLALSGRTLSMDFRWTDMDLVLMQDPTARLGRDTGKNVLALRSSGALTVSSSGVGESVDVQLRDASLLPCFYADEEGGRGEEGGGVSSGVARRNGSSGSGSGGGPAQRLALILGGGESAMAAVARTWLGQGLVTADARPLLEPFTMQVGYGTVVARAAAEGRGTDVMDGRRRRSSALSGYDDSEEEGGGGDGGGLVVPSPAMRRREGEGDDAGSMHDEDCGAESRERNGLVDQSVAGEFVSGVFRVAVSEVQLLGAKRNADEEVATVEIMVRKSAALPRHFRCSVTGCCRFCVAGNFRR